MTVPGQGRESGVNFFSLGWRGLLVCVFRRSFGVQAVAAWCEYCDFDLNLDPVSPTSLLGRPCNVWLTTLWRLASLRLLRQLLPKTCVE